MSEIKVPLVIRGLHWGIAVIFLSNVLILPHGDGPHRLLGLLGVILVVARLSLMLKYKMTYLNPNAIIVYTFMWTSVIGLGITGWMTQLDVFWGNRSLKQFHAVIAYILSLLVIVHLAGVFFHAFRHKRKTWMKMISGD